MNGLKGGHYWLKEKKRRGESNSCTAGVSGSFGGSQDVNMKPPFLLKGIVSGGKEQWGLTSRLKGKKKRGRVGCLLKWLSILF